MDEPVEHHEAGEGPAGHVAERRLTVRSSAPGAWIASASAESAGPKPASTSSVSAALGSVPRKAAANIVAPSIMWLEDAAHREFGARRRVVELIGRDVADDAGEQGAELVELDPVGPWLLLALVRRGSEFGRLSVTTELDERRHPATWWSDRVWPR